MMRARATVAALLAGVALAAGCGDDDEPETVTETVTQSEPAPAAGTTTTEPNPEGGADVAKADAERDARKEASAQLESQPGGFSVPEEDWDVECTGGEDGGAWDCQLNSGPCNGTATVTPQGGEVVTEAKAGCIPE